MAAAQPNLTDLLFKKPHEQDTQAYNTWTVEFEKEAMFNVSDHDISRDICSCARYLNVYNSALEVNNLLLLKDVFKYLAEKHQLEAQAKDCHTSTEKELFAKFQDVQKALKERARTTVVENPNICIVRNYLRKSFQEKGEYSRAIVFVTARATCRALATFIDEDIELKAIGVRASPLFGQQKRGEDEGMTGSVQTEVLEKLKNGQYKVVVCTSVGTEGIDVPDCNIVINYNYSGNEITKLQMKGRSRKKGASHLLVGFDKQVEQDKVNAYKAGLMYKAMEKVEKLDPMYVRQMIQQFQKDEIQKHKVEQEKAKQIKTSEDDLEIRCKHCNAKATQVSDVRQLGTDYLVLDNSFKDRINTKPHNSPKKYAGKEKKSKMYCKECPLDWGIVAERDGTDLWILKVKNFKFVNKRTHVQTTYKKWLEVPYNVPKIGFEDFPRLFGNPE